MLIIQNYQNPIMLSIVDNNKYFLNELDKIITNKILFEYSNPKLKNNKIQINIKLDKKERKKEYEKEFVKIIFNRIKYKAPFINDEELNNWLLENEDKILKYLNEIIIFNYT